MFKVNLKSHISIYKSPSWRTGISLVKCDLLDSRNNRFASLSIVSHTVLWANQFNGNLELFHQSEPGLPLAICVQMSRLQILHTCKSSIHIEYLGERGDITSYCKPQQGAMQVLLYFTKNNLIKSLACLPNPKTFNKLEKEKHYNI